MTFGAAIFLLGALAAVIPLILHLINRQQAKLLPFPTLRFLRISVEKTRRRRRLEDLLLMLLRMAVLVFIAVALAKPTLTSLAALMAGDARSAVAIVLDNSASMGTIDEGRPRWETALRAAEQILDQLRAGDEIALFPTSGPQFPEAGKFDRTQAKVRQLLAQIQLSYEGADLTAQIDSARRLLLESDAPNRYLFVISDFQRVGFPAVGESPEDSSREDSRPFGDRSPGQESGANSSPAAQGAFPTPEAARPFSDAELRSLRKVPLVMVDCHRNPRPNVGIVGGEATAPVPVARVPVYTTANLLNGSPVAQQRAVILLANGVKLFEGSAVSLPAGEITPYRFQFNFPEGGIQRCEVRLVGEDGLSADDRWFFAMEINIGIPVAIVVSQIREIPFLDDSFYLENALLAAGAGIQVNKLTATQLAGEPLDRYKVIFCVNVPGFSGEALSRLQRFVESGGALVWLCGPDVDPTAYNDIFEQTQGSILPSRLVQVRDPRQVGNQDSFRVTWIDTEHPVLRLLSEPPSLYQSVLVYRHVQLATGQPEGGRALARLDDGEPILVEKRSGRGTVIFWGSSAHVGWTNFPLRPIFLPLMARLTYQLAGTEQRRYQLLAGRPLIVSFEDQIPPRVAEVLPPSGALIRKELRAEGDTRVREFRYTETYEPGFYQVRLLEGGSPRTITFAVNVHPEETTPEKIERSRLEAFYRPSPVIWAGNPEDLSATFQYLREGRSLWEFFLFAVLLGLVFETFLANFLTPKQERPTAVLLPPWRARRLPQALVPQ